MRKPITKMELYQIVDRKQRRLIRWLWLYKLITRIKEVFHGQQ